MTARERPDVALVGLGLSSQHALELIEQAKGILMARHAIAADRAFGMLRDHSQHNGHRLADVAAAIVDSHPSC